MTRLVCWLSILLLASPVPPAMSKDTSLIAVSSNFAPATEVLIRKFKLSTGEHVIFSSGASGTLTRQIEQGAPYELFLSADEDYVARLYANGLTVDSGKIYALGLLVLYIPYSSKLDRMQDLDGIITQLARNTGFRYAIANPAVAPYGMAAEQVMDRFSTVAASNQNIIKGENVGQVAQFALTGNVDAAFIPYSLALLNSLQEKGHFEPIPIDWYSPINQRMVLMKKAGHTTREFYKFMSSDSARQIIKKHGFELPQEH